MEQPNPYAVKTVLSLISRCTTSTCCLSLSLSWNCEFGPFNFQFHYSHQSSELEGRKGNPTPTIKISIPRSTWNHLKQTQLHNSKTPGLIRVRPSRPGHGSTRRVDRVLPGHCTGRSLDKPKPVQPPGRPVPGSTRRAGPGLITMLVIVFISGLVPFLLLIFFNFILNNK